MKVGWRVRCVFEDRSGVVVVVIARCGNFGCLKASCLKRRLCCRETWLVGNWNDLILAAFGRL